MISVIIPTYNEEANITACLQSLSNQTIRRDEYEIIVVDGNSKDSTCELARAYADEVMTQTSPKVGGARNDGVLRARGDIVATTDAGDDVEMALRMRKLGRVMLDGRMKVGFSMRRFQQFGMIKSVYEWLYIVANGGKASKYSYTKRNYK